MSYLLAKKLIRLVLVPAAAWLAAPNAAFAQGVTVSIESQGGGCSVTDNTSALLAAVNSVTGPVRVMFTNNCTYNFTQTNAINFSKHGVYLEGTGQRSTTLQYTPSADGTFLQWYDGLNEIFFGGISKLSLLSTDTTHTKVMVNWYDVSDFDLHELFCGGGTTTGVSQLRGGSGSSTCFYSHGRDEARITKISTNAQVSFHIGMNPHWYGSADHYHFSDLTLIGDIGSGTHPLIVVDPGVVFTSTTFDGEQAWVGGTHGFHYNDTAATHYVSAVTAAGSGYTAGAILTLTGGTCSTPIQVQVLKVNGTGGILEASVANPGVCSVTPTNPVSASSGGGAFNLTLVAGYRLSFANVRSEQGVSDSAHTFYIAPAGQQQGVTITNSSLDSFRCGVFLKNTFFTTIQQSSYLFWPGGGCHEAVNATSANLNDMLVYIQNFWLAGVTHNITGMYAVQYDPSPGGTSSTVPPTARYSSSTSGTSVTNLGVALSIIQNGPAGYVALSTPAAVGPAVTNVWGSTAGTIATSVASPLAQNSTTGTISCPTCSTSAGPSALAVADASGAGLTLTDGSAACNTSTHICGKYQINGNMVDYYASVTYPATASTAAAKLNLPVTVPNADYAAQCYVTRQNGNFTIQAQPVKNTANLVLFSIGGAVITNANMSGLTFSFHCRYPTT